jgi:hypothetical protein
MESLIAMYIGAVKTLDFNACSMMFIQLVNILLAGTRFLRPSPLKGVNPAGTPGTESFFGLKGRPSVVRDVEIHNQPVLRKRRK